MEVTKAINIKQLDEHWLIRKSLTERFLEASFEKHDNTQLEMVLKYRENTNFKREKQKYFVDFYFFFPSSLKLVEKGYKARHFYFNLTKHIRLRSPVILPSEFLSETDVRFPIGKLYDLKRKMLEDTQLDLTESAMESFKFTANYLLNFLKTINIDGCFPREYCFENHYEAELELSEALLGAFRTILTRYREIFTNRYPGFIERVDFLDEYVSYMFETNWAQFLTKNAAESFKDKVRHQLERELDYRRQRNYTIPAQDSGAIKESFVYRLSLLKKFVQSQLYLDEKYVKVKNYLIQFIAMFAAGLAAMTAYSLELFRNQINPVLGLTPGILIIISSLIYILKDRIKDFIKLVVGKKVIRKFDTARKLLLPTDPSKSFAEFRELVYITGKSHVDREILDIREYPLSQRLDKTKVEDVIHYSKKMEIDWKRLKEQGPTILHEVKEIFRFNLKDFLQGMDDPKQTFVAYDREKKTPEQLEMDKLYHINVVLHIHNRTGKQEEDNAFYRIRLIVDRKGIRNIQNIPVSSI